MVRIEFTSDRLYDFLENLTNLFSEYSFVAMFYLSKDKPSPKIIDYFKTENAVIKDSVLDSDNPESISFQHSTISDLIDAIKKHQEQFYIPDEEIFCNHSFGIHIFQPTEKIFILFRNNFEFSADWLFDLCYLESGENDGSLILGVDELLTHSENKSLNALFINNLDMFPA